MKSIINRFEYNAPVVLTFALLSTGILFLDQGVPLNLINGLFTFYGVNEPLNIPNLLLWPLGHASVDHLAGNMTYILLIGPLLEEKYGSRVLLGLIVVSSIIIGLVQWLLFGSGILGASGIVYMLIVMTSFTNEDDGKIPVTFVLIALIFFGREVFNGLFVQNNISELAHILGGIIGLLYLRYFNNKK